MTDHYPRIRIKGERDYVFIRDGITICFYMHRSHRELGAAVVSALDLFKHALRPHTLTIHPDTEGYWQTLQDEDWRRLQKDLLENEHPLVTVASNSKGVSEFAFEYRGVSFETTRWFDAPGRACEAIFHLPTEYIEEHGPGHVRELALALASHLPFNSGYASLSFNAIMDHIGVTRRVRSVCFRYPGMDVIDDSVADDIGTRVRGAYWLTFLGQPVLGELGGVEALRARLSSPGTTVQQLEGDRAVVTLGQWPEAGDLEAGDNLPAHRELARVLEPWLYHSNPDGVFDSDFPPQDKLRWVRRFLD